MAAMHNVDVDAVGLSDYGRPGNYFERQVGRWSKQYRASETKHIPAMETLMDYLSSNLPEDDGVVSLVHGDYRLDNMTFHPTETQVVAVLDTNEMYVRCREIYLPEMNHLHPHAGPHPGSTIY